MNGLSIISLVVCLGLLTLRFFLSRDAQRRTGRQRIKYVRILISAALALATIGYVLQRHSIRPVPGVSGVIATGGGSKPAEGGRECVETYGITLHTSEFFVREMPGGGPFRPKNSPRELSTVVRGNARNGCGQPLKKVQIRIKVHGDGGKNGAAWADVGDLGAGQSKPFERAWMGRVTSYEIAEVR